MLYLRRSRLLVAENSLFSCGTEEIYTDNVRVSDRQRNRREKRRASLRWRAQLEVLEDPYGVVRRRAVLC